jgi:hypothetical protein
MRFPLPRATSTVRNQLDLSMYKRVVGTFNSSRWVSGSAGLDPAAPGGLLVMALLTVMNAISVGFARWSNRPHVPAPFRGFPSFPSRTPSGTEARMVVKLLLLAAVASGMSAWIVGLAAVPTHEIVALLLAWIVFACAACLLD